MSYALALYAGMRNCERKPLDWSLVDFGKGRLGLRESKSDAGVRWLPIVAPLRVILREEWMRQGRPADGLVCRGPKGGVPDYKSMVTRARKAWAAAGLEPIGFHECRHTFITTMIHAGLNAKAVTSLAGHASIDVTYDRYGHLFPGAEDEAGRRLDAFLTPNRQLKESDLEAMSRNDLLGLLKTLVSNPVSNEAREAAESTL